MTPVMWAAVVSVINRATAYYNMAMISWPAAYHYSTVRSCTNCGTYTYLCFGSAKGKHGYQGYYDYF